MKSRKRSRRAILRSVSAAGAAGLGGTTTAAAQRRQGRRKRVFYRGKKPENTPLFSSAIAYGNLLFIAGKGAHFDGNVKDHTEHVLSQIQEELENAGSSMDKVLKAQVYLRTLDDYSAMNEVFRGRFGPEPPVRTTVACADGIPGDSLVEIDVIAYI